MKLLVFRRFRTRRLRVSEFYLGTMEMTPIHDAVKRAQRGEHPYFIAKLETCWVVAMDQPFLKGHCVTLADPVVFSVNDLDEENPDEIFPRCL